MGSPHIRVLACLFLESGPFLVPKVSNYFPFINDILLIYPWNHDFTKIIDKLIKLEPTIDFTYKLGTNNIILFLDILLINKDK